MRSSLLPLLVFAVTGAVMATAACGSSPSSPQEPVPAPATTTPVSPSPPNPGESEQSKEVPKDPTTEIIFGVDTEDFKLEGYNLTGHTIEVKVDGVIAASETVQLPHETRVIAPKDKPDAVAEIVVKGVMNQADVVTRRATVHFVKGKSLLAYIRLEIRCNNFGLLGGSGISGPTCDKPNETCIGAKCTSDALVNLPDYRTDWATNPPSACGAGTASTIALGLGQEVMTPINDNDTVSVECGPQGGHHLWMALSMKDLAQLGTTTTFSASQPGTAITVPATAYPYSYTAAANGSCELLSLRFQLDSGGVNIKDILGKPLDIKVDGVDKSGRTATATRKVNIAAERSGGGMCRPLN